MSSTPRLRSGFPSTPTTVPRRSNQYDDTPSTVGSLGSISSNGASTRSYKAQALPQAPEREAAEAASSQPLIPLTLIDAPQQRLYAFGVYVVLWGWKLFDWLSVIEEGEASWWLFLKWFFIDFGFLFGLPELRIPWLELSQPVVSTIVAFHAFLNYMLMFNIQIPLMSAVIAFVKVFYDRELSISEHNVKISNILNNHSLIMGKQVINILPEGSAVLNPDDHPFCIGHGSSSVSIPLHFNATVPAEIELMRLDLDSGKEETVKLSKREVNKLAKLVRDQNADPASDGFRWDYPVKKTGVYRLSKVLDEYKLEVQRRSKDTYVVPCPKARFQATDPGQRCIQDLSNLALEVEGTPPLKIHYSRKINEKNHSFHFQSLQPDGFVSPLVGTSSSITTGTESDLDWIRPAKVSVEINESMSSPGQWEYTIDEVFDAFGNQVSYATTEESPKPLSKDLTQTFKVKERPTIKMEKFNLRNPVKIAKGDSTVLPAKFRIADGVEDTAHQITWQFSPIDSLTNSGDHGDQVSYGSFSARNSHEQAKVSQPGLYTLKSVSSGGCEGQVQEPSSVLVLNPLEPSLFISSEEISDKCAGNSIGLRVDLDLVGEPPFEVYYETVTSQGVQKHRHQANSLRSQLELIPQSAGHYRYIFRSMDDKIYKGLPLSGEDKVLEQVVKPAANAWMTGPSGHRKACLDSQVSVDIAFSGDPPFTLEWEMVHDGKRKTHRVTDIEEPNYTITTNPLTKGGEYILALKHVQDKRACRAFLSDNLKIAVRRERPRARFGLLDKKRSVMTKEDERTRLPLRLEGEGPWTVSYRNLNVSSHVIERSIDGENGYLPTQNRGIYELVDVKDSQCPGVIDKSASTFAVDWYARPELDVVKSHSMSQDSKGVFLKQDVCEGDVDAFDITLQGVSPWRVQYQVKHQPAQGSGSLNPKSFDAAQPKASITMETSKPGDYTYKFYDLSDNLYDNHKSFSPITVQQHVSAKPSAVFTKPGQSFKYCMQEQEQEDAIPIKLTGTAPFFVEIEVKHQAGSAPETYNIPPINSNAFGIQIPRQYLRLGSQQVRILRVRDARGCQKKYDYGGPSIQIQLYDAPSIYPLESRNDFCVGERIGYTLSGTPPFNIAYDFGGQWQAKSQTTSFRRVAEKPGEFIITSISDKASECRAAVNLHKTIHPLPSVQISQGRQSHVDIHEGGEVEMQFDFWGTPPFEFTYTRSSNARKGQKSVVLETRHDVSHEHRKVVRARQEGTYEVVAIKDHYCAFSTQQVTKDEGR